MHEKLTVCLVDDDKNVLRTLEILFKSAGFKVLAFDSPETFLQNVPEDPDTAVLLDLRMPQISGLEVLRQLKSRGTPLPVLIHSSHADVEATVQVFEDGAFTLIQKPASKTLLIEKVKEAILEKRQASQRYVDTRDARLRLADLTPREREIAERLARGISAPAIAQEVFLSARTVETHRLNIFRKLGIKSSAELARITTLAEI